jgi:hypothetical protein
MSNLWVYERWTSYRYLWQRETGRQRKETGNAWNPYSKLADIVTAEVIFFQEQIL